MNDPTEPRGGSAAAAAEPLFARRFAGRTAIITGGASFLGLDVARRIVAEGGAVILWDRDAGALDEAAAADAMQALLFIRTNARRLGIDPGRVGMMGFSAGGMTMLRVLSDADDGARPDIAASIYGLLFDEGVRPESTPMFIAVARDDESVPHSEAIHTLWREAGAPSELHVFENGGHGFGLGRPGTDSAAFATLFETWLRAQGFITTER